MSDYKPSPSITTRKPPTAGQAGAGFSGMETLDIRISDLNNEVVTTILIDITGLADSGTVKDIIGDNGEAAAYFLRTTLSTTGLIYKVEMACLETPAGSNCALDIDFVSNTASLAEDAAYDSGTAMSVLAPGGNWATGVRMETATSVNAGQVTGDYLYLANGTGANSGGTYTGGKFLIKLYGVNSSFL